MSIWAHNAFIYYISKMFYYTPNAHWVFMLITLIIYISNRCKICILSREKSHLVISHFHFDFNVRKKRKVRNILIINNLYINIYFFCYQFIEKWQMTNDFLPITTLNTMILNNLHTQKSHFFASFCPERSFFNCNQKCTNRVFSGFNR